MDAKKYLHELLDYASYRLDHGCTKSEIDSLARVLEKNLELYGEAKDFADFFGVSENNVRTAISRKLSAKPRRRVYYPFQKFLKIVPEKWLHKNDDAVSGKDRPTRDNQEVTSH